MPIDLGSEGAGVALLFAGVGIMIGAAFVMLLLGQGGQPPFPTMLPQQAAQTQSPVPVMTNKEVIEWKDWRGRNRTITIHREVH